MVFFIVLYYKMQKLKNKYINVGEHMNTAVCYMWLKQEKMPSPNKALALIAHFGSPSALYEADKKSLVELDMLLPSEITALCNKDLEKVKKEYDMCRENSVWLVDIENECYPSLLKKIANPPLVLYVKGSKEVLKTNCISLVGARQADFYGTSVAFELAKNLASIGLTVVSGFARGIDISAHKGALDARGKTIAVYASGIDVLYPSDNAGVDQEIIDGGGAVISEYPFKMEPLKQNFPYRNRIISGMSQITMLLQARARSGSLITTTYAQEQGREVYALPGNITNSLSEGPNELIRDGAVPIIKMSETLTSVIERYNLSWEEEDEEDDRDEEGKILDEIDGQALTVDEIHRATNVEIGKVTAILVMLEIEGQVKMISGNRYTVIS